MVFFFFFSSRRRHTRCSRDWSSDVCSSDLHLRYPVGELFGTLWAIITRRLAKKNIFDDKHAVQCATFVRMCYQAIGHDPVTGAVHLTNTSPESFYQSQLFTFRKEWHRPTPSR